MCIRDSLIPPALPRPPERTWDLMATGPIWATKSAISSALVNTCPFGTGIPLFLKISLAMYSYSLTLMAPFAYFIERVHLPYRYYNNPCLLYTSDAADEEDSVDLGGRRIIKK